LVKLRPEVVEGNLHGIISLYALLDQDPAAFEGNPHRVLRATYPSVALTGLLRRLQTSLRSDDADRKGNFIIGGGYGSGKSHLLLTLYHVLAHPEQSRPWLAEHEIDFDPPQDAAVVLMPMTNLTQPGSGAPVEYLWTPIFAALGYDGFRHTGSNFPTVVDLRKAVAGRKVFLVIDEIERWFMPIRDRHQAEANVSFLQNLTEFARNPDNSLFVFLTLLMLEPRIGNIVGRDDAFFEDLTQAPDRRQVVLYRLVEEVTKAGAKQGFPLNTSHLRHSERLSRLFLVVAVAYLWMVCLGVQTICQDLADWVDRSNRRILSIFKTGWRWFKRQLKLRHTVLIHLTLPANFELPELEYL
jgi:hypothetical protein